MKNRIKEFKEIAKDCIRRNIASVAIGALLAFAVAAFMDHQWNGERSNPCRDLSVQEEMQEYSQKERNEIFSDASVAVNSLVLSDSVYLPVVAVKPEEVAIEETEEVVLEAIEEDAEEELGEEIISIGEFKLTAYCSCAKCCGKWAKNRPVDEEGNEIVIGACGVPLKAGISIAVDKRVIPYGSSVYINGHEYIAQDCGGAIKGNRIDVYFDDHQEADDFGVQYAEVFVKKQK